MSYQSFEALSKKFKKRGEWDDSDLSVLSSLTKDELIGKFLCRIERHRPNSEKSTNELRLYDTLDGFLPLLRKENRRIKQGRYTDHSGQYTTYHEMVLDSEQKLKLDVDCSIEQLDTIEARYFVTLEDPIKTLTEILGEMSEELETSGAELSSEVPFDVNYVVNIFVDRDNMIIDDTNEEQMEEFANATADTDTDSDDEDDESVDGAKSPTENSRVIDTMNIFREAKFRLIIAELKAAINRIYSRNYRAVADSVNAPRHLTVNEFYSSQAGEKYSAHVIVQGVYVRDSSQARAFNTMLRANLWDDIAALLDATDKRVQNLRMVWSAKKGKRQKQLPKDCDIRDAFVTQFDRKTCFELPYLNVESGLVDMAKTKLDKKGGKRKGNRGGNGVDGADTDGSGERLRRYDIARIKGEYDVNDIRTAVTAIEDAYPEFTLRENASIANTSTFLNFDRNPGYSTLCEWCDVMHHADNNLWAKLNKHGNNIYVNVGCAKFNHHKSQGNLGPNAQEVGNKYFMSFTSVVAPTLFHNPALEKTHERNIRVAVEMFADKGSSVDSGSGGKYVDTCISSQSRSRRPAKEVDEDAEDDSDSNGSERSNIADSDTVDGSGESSSEHSEDTGSNAGSRTSERAARDIERDLRWVGKLEDDTRKFRQNEKISCMIYDESSLRDYDPSYRTLVVHAPMKLGKTQKLLEYLSTNYANDIIGQKIVFISFRQTFTANIKAKFTDFVSYSDSRGVLNSNRVIVQMESLHRLVITDTPPALVILDECESIFEQVDSGLHKEFNEAFARFEYLLKHAEKVILMDANITRRTYKIIKEIRGLDGMQYHRNMYRNASKDTYHFTQDDSIMFLMMRHDITVEGKRIVFVSNSLAAARALERIAIRDWGLADGEVKIYSSRTPASEKKQHFGDVGKYWSAYKLLIYTPTVSAGVSFEVKHYHAVYAYFMDTSCGAETCIQMLGRIRDVAEKRYVICTKSITRNQPVTTKDIIKRWGERRKNLLENCNEYVHFRYGRTGKPEIKKTVYFVVYSQNLIQRNISRNGFIMRFMQLVTQYGAKVRQLDVEETLASMGTNKMDVDEVRSKIKEARGEVEELDHQLIVDADEIDDEEFDAIREKMKSSELDVSIEEVAMHDKKSLRRFYRHEYPKPITLGFVKKYNKREVKSIYKNLERVLCPDMEDEVTYLTAKEKIDELHANEIDEYHRSLAGTNEASARELRYKYSAAKHNLAIDLVVHLGWHHFMDTDRHHTTDHMYERFTMPETISIMTKLWREFDFDKRLTKNEIYAKIRGVGNDRHAFVRDMIKSVNSMYNALYGLKIVEKKDRGDDGDDPEPYFFLNFRELFAFPDEYGARGFGEDIPRLRVRLRNPARRNAGIDENANDEDGEDVDDEVDNNPEG